MNLSNLCVSLIYKIQTKQHKNGQKSRLCTYGNKLLQGFLQPFLRRKLDNVGAKWLLDQQIILYHTSNIILIPFGQMSRIWWIMDIHSYRCLWHFLHIVEHVLLYIVTYDLTIILNCLFTKNSFVILCKAPLKSKIHVSNWKYHSKIQLYKWSQQFLFIFYISKKYKFQM